MYIPSKIYPLSLLKCIGITFVVINHTSGLGPNLHGGLNILAYITGFLFFSMLSQSCLKVTVSSFLKLTFKMLILSSAIVMFTYLLKKLFDYPIRTSFFFCSKARARQRSCLCPIERFVPPFFNSRLSKSRV